MTNNGKSIAFKAIHEEALKLIDELSNIQMPNKSEDLLREKLLLIVSIARYQVDVRAEPER